MRELIGRIRERLANGAYVNEAAVSHGIVTPILNALGWDSADPTQLVPEYTIERGRVDFALFGLGHRPAVFIEVKGIGRAVEADRQLFEYAFHAGVPNCVLTDGREWSFYLPAAQGSYDDRRVYRLQLDDRDPAKSEQMLIRYLGRDRVRDGRAGEDALRDYRNAAGKREAALAVPRAWDQLVAEPDPQLIELLSERTEALSGFRPDPTNLAMFVQALKVSGEARSVAQRAPAAASPAVSASVQQPPARVETRRGAAGSAPVTFTLRGRQHECVNASLALIELLRLLADRDPTKVPALAQAVEGRTRSLIAGNVTEINPARPDLARAAEFAPGWLIGLNTSNREKMGIIRTAAEIYGLTIPDDLDISLPNAT